MWNELKKWIGAEIGMMKRDLSMTQRLQKQVGESTDIPQYFIDVMDDRKRILKKMGDLEKDREKLERTEHCKICGHVLTVDDPVVVDKYLDYYHVTCYHSKYIE